MSAASGYEYRTTGTLNPIDDHVLIYNIETTDEKVRNGIIILDEESNERGIRARWAQVYKVGPNQTEIQPDQWVLIEHGRWTRGITLDDGNTYRKADVNCIMLVSDEKPNM